MKKAFKILGWVFCLFFLYAVVVQYNDPDALTWYLLYGTAAWASLWFALGKLKFWWALVLCLGYLALAFVDWPQQFEGVALKDGMKTVNVEEGRESLGMGICSFAMLLYMLGIRFQKRL